MVRIVGETPNYIEKKSKENKLTTWLSWQSIKTVEFSKNISVGPPLYSSGCAILFPSDSIQRIT